MRDYCAYLYFLSSSTLLCNERIELSSILMVFIHSLKSRVARSLFELFWTFSRLHEIVDCFLDIGVALE